MEPTGYSAPNSAGHSLNTSGTVTSEVDAVVPPAKRLAHPTPAAPAVAALPASTSSTTPIEVIRSSSSSSGVQSVASSAEKSRRLALARAKRETARRHLKRAQASEEVADGELDEVLANAVAGNLIGRVADFDGDDGNIPLPQIHDVQEGEPWQPLQLPDVQGGELCLPAHLQQVEAFGSPAKARGQEVPPAKAGGLHLE